MSGRDAVKYRNAFDVGCVREHVDHSRGGTPVTAIVH